MARICELSKLAAAPPPLFKMARPSSAKKCSMAKRKNFTPCVFVPYRLRDQVPAGSVVYDVSSYAEFPFCTLSPMWPHGGIPVPGMPGTTSDSVEGIWQGLKVIDRKIAPRYFTGQGHKRGGKP